MQRLNPESERKFICSFLEQQSSRNTYLKTKLLTSMGQKINFYQQKFNQNRNTNFFEISSSSSFDKSLNNLSYKSKHVCSRRVEQIII
ncbi:hypothetical protein BpHYR1_026593 [Brachionus plicatilis]|uniref:Uncharacterized protein n=1 Tax=Brachionus plicatilis TaxID=10195 RepID=A0A3M7Q5N5_BRAPC|nr:hypothetical protein BpHYR1_026593 [Brachionus plicatilis]